MKFKYLPVIAGILLMTGLLLNACKGPTSPAEAFLTDTISIIGTGFSVNPEDNFVAFGKQAAQVISASETEIRVILPKNAGGVVKLKASVKGAVDWSNKIDFTFRNAIEVIDDEIVHPGGIDVDADGNVFVISRGDETIYKISPGGEKNAFVTEIPANGGIHFGPDNFLYVCEQNEGKIVRISSDGATIEDVVELESPIDFDWNMDGTMYIVSNWVGIFKYTGQDSVEQVATIGSPKTCRVFENALYVATSWDNQLLKFEITSSGLENMEVLAEPELPMGMEIANDGTIYYGPYFDATLHTLAPDGAKGTLFPGELTAPMRFMAFVGKQIYAVNAGAGLVGVVLKVFTAAQQAPRYGR